MIVNSDLLKYFSISKSEKAYESSFLGPKYITELETWDLVHQQSKLIVATKPELPLWTVKPDSTNETLNLFFKFKFLNLGFN